MRNKDNFVSKCTLRRVQLMSDFLANLGDGDNKQSTASLLVNWIHKMAADPAH